MKMKKDFDKVPAKVKVAVRVLDWDATRGMEGECVFADAHLEAKRKSIVKDSVQIIYNYFMSE